MSGAVLIILYMLVFKARLILAQETEVVVLRAVRGREARLPCGQGRVFLDGPDAYVLWLKEDRDMLYRFPNEENRKRPEMTLTSGCVGDLCEDETALLLKDVGEDEEGQYRCRVHYQASPSVDYVIDVRLVDSPGSPRILYEKGGEVTKGFVGPLSIGSELNLFCEVANGQTDTLLYWRRNGAVIERANHSTQGSMRAPLQVRGLTRNDLNAHFECMAQNGDVTEPLTSSVVVKMNLPPLSVEIRLNNNLDFEAGQPRVVDCVVVGCVPPPTVTWHLGDTLLRPSVHKELHDGNYTVSSLTLAPSLRDNGQRLVCHAHNPHLPAAFEHAVVVNVGYRPVCLTSSQNAIGIVPHQAETVTCILEAVPEPQQVTWSFDTSRTLYTSVQKVRGHLNRYTSTLTWLPTERDMGMLQCRATNMFGEQKRACEYEVRVGGPPATPRCTLLRAYPGTITVKCVKGWDGGRVQIVHVELSTANGERVRNATSASGEFRFDDVTEDGNLTAQVYASSARGRSQPFVMHVVTNGPFTASVVSTEKPQLEIDFSHWLAVALCTLLVAVLIIIAALFALAIRAKIIGNYQQPPDLTLSRNYDPVPRSDGTFHREPDVAVAREACTTNITVQQLATASPHCPDAVWSSSAAVPALSAKRNRPTLFRRPDGRI